MVQPGMRITVDAAMRARDVARPRPEGEEPKAPAAGPSGAAGDGAPGSGRRTKAAKNERRRLGKRGGGPRRPSADGG